MTYDEYNNNFCNILCQLQFRLQNIAIAKQKVPSGGRKSLSERADQGEPCGRRGALLKTQERTTQHDPERVREVLQDLSNILCGRMYPECLHFT